MLNMTLPSIRLHTVSESRGGRDELGGDLLLGLAQQEVNRRWATYEEMAMQGAERFPPGAQRSD